MTGHSVPGRSCPTDYQLSDDVFWAEPQLECPVLYVAGGVYGNLWALDSMERLAASEPGAALVLNGDTHWFDVDAGTFTQIERRAVLYHPLVGNVEAELRRPFELDIGAGCGCAYPEYVSQDAVNRSNEIHSSLKQIYLQLPEFHSSVESRPMSLLARVAGQRVAIVHGDESMLAGWSCSRERLIEPGRQAELRQWMRERDLSALATSHSCAPAMLAWNDAVVINNGAAGMPNFSRSGEGICTRIARCRHPQALYRACIGELFIEAMPIPYDQKAFLGWFDSLWPAGSPAAQSYRMRIVHGTGENPADALVGPRS
jgi:hypothetical protein